MQSLTTESSTSSSKTDEIKALRQQIDQTDEALALSLMERYVLSQKVQKLKKEMGMGSYSPIRENEILQRLKFLYPMIPNTTMENIYREIFDWMRPKD